MRRLPPWIARGAQFDGDVLAPPDKTCQETSRLNGDVYIYIYSS